MNLTEIREWRISDLECHQEICEVEWRHWKNVAIYQMELKSSPNCKLKSKRAKIGKSLTPKRPLLLVYLLTEMQSYD